MVSTNNMKKKKLTSREISKTPAQFVYNPKDVKKKKMSMAAYEKSKKDIEEDKEMISGKKDKKYKKTKPQGKGIVKALGQKSTTGNFKKIEKAKGKGAAIGALINKYDKVHGNKPRYSNLKKKSGSEMLKR